VSSSLLAAPSRPPATVRFRSVVDTIACMEKHSVAAQELLATIDAAALKNAKKRGHTEISWNHVETQQREQLAGLVDRAEVVEELFDTATDPALKLKASQELRQINKAIDSLLSAIQVDEPLPESRRTQKARAAANARWSRDAG
jgi:hypothetical protein